MKFFFKILLLLTISFYIVTSCVKMDINIDENTSNFIGKWKLYKVTKTDSTYNTIEINVTNKDKTNITIEEDYTFKGVLYFLDSVNPEISGIWEKTDKDILSLIINDDDESKNENSVLILYKKDDFCILNHKTFYQKDTVNTFIFSKQ